MIKTILCFIAFYFFSSTSFAAGAGRSEGGLGEVAQNLMEPVSVAADFVNTGCFIIGIAFIMTAIIKYKEYRRSPLMTPLGTVIFLLVAGILLILLPLAYKLTENGIPYTLLK